MTLCSISTKLATVLTLSFILPSYWNRVPADDWPHWMGPRYNNVWQEEGIVAQVPENGLDVLWRQPIQGGYSGPSISDGRVFVMDFVSEPTEGDTGRLRSREGTERVLCFDAQTGQQLWSHEYVTRLAVSYPGGPRSTPFVDGNRVYAQGTMGEVICLQVADGQVVWKKNLAEEFETKPPVWGYASHPLVVDDLLICAVGGEGRGVVAMDKQTGQEMWSAITAREIGYAPFVLARLQDKMQLIVWYDVAVAGLDIANGQELWTYAFPKAKPQRPVVSIVPPHVHENRIFITNFYHGSALFEVTEDGPQELWSTEKDTKHEKDINSIMSSVLFRDNCYFGVAGNGEIRCVAAKDGELQWKSYQALATAEEDPAVSPRGDKGFPGLFIIEQGESDWLFTDQGELIQAQLSVEGYRELGRTKLLETTATTRGRNYVWCAPACADGRMYLRNEREIICVDMRDSSYPH